MNDLDPASPAQSPSAARRLGTIILGFIFVLALVVFITAALISRDLLDPDLYTNALEEERFYDRIYSDLLADPEMVDITALALGNIGLNPELSDEVLSFTTSTLYLVLPPETIKSGVEDLIGGVTAYLRGDVEELQPELVFEGLDSEVLANRIVDGVMAFLGELLADETEDQQIPATGMETIAVEKYLAAIGNGEIVPFTREIANADISGLSDGERAELLEVITKPVQGTISESSSRQIDIALSSNDLPGALILASRELLLSRVQQAAVELAGTLQDSPELSAVRSGAAALGQSTAEFIASINRVRAVMIALDSVAVPVAFIVMVLCLIAIAWINSDSLMAMLRAAGGTLLIGSGLVALLWLVVGFLLRDSLADAFANSEALPSSLENMILDVAANISNTIWQDVWQTALIPVLLGALLFGASFLSRLPETAGKVLKPLQQNKVLAIAVLLVVVLLPVALLVFVGGGQEDVLLCNGHAELCDRPVNEVAFATTHNAMSIAEYGWLWPSHDGTVTDQLNAGVRGFLIDSHYWDDKGYIQSELEDLPQEIQAGVNNILDKIELGKEEGDYLCHMMCSLGATDIVETLTEIRQFLEEHPGEVIVFIIEDRLTPEDTSRVFTESGLDALVYTPEDGNDWPTLREMIEENRRVLVMAEKEGPPPDWYLQAWDYTEETPYHFSRIEDLDETSCQPNRGETGKPFFLLNHWVTRVSPSRADAAMINEYEYLLERAQRCAEERGHIPNLVGVNFYLNGDVFDVVDELNGVREETVQN